MLAIAREEDVILPNHLTSTKHAPSHAIHHVALDTDEDFARLLVLLVDDVILVEPHLFKLPQVVQVKGVRTILEKGHLINSFLVQKSEQLNLDRSWQDLKQELHVLL